ncbi:MAG: 30S ribosomal protein S8 [Gammaproteobacteria bacterium]
MNFDMIVRLKNSSRIKSDTVKVVASSLTLKIAEILSKEGFIRSFQILKYDGKDFILIKLKYQGLQRQCYIASLVRISRPGSRVYIKSSNIPKVLGGIGIAVFSS